MKRKKRLTPKFKNENFRKDVIYNLIYLRELITWKFSQLLFFKNNRCRRYINQTDNNQKLIKMRVI